MNKQGTPPPSYFVQSQDIGNEVHIHRKPLTFDHIPEVIVLFFFNVDYDFFSILFFHSFFLLAFYYFLLLDIECLFVYFLDVRFF